MPDYSPEIYRKAAEAVERELMSGTYYDTHVESEDALARAALDAVAEDLGNAVAAKILGGLKFYADPDKIRLPQTHDASARALRRHYQAAARIASWAFLGDDDLKAIPEERDKSQLGSPFAASYPGSCAWCGDRIREGDMIRRAGDREYICGGCSA